MIKFIACLAVAGGLSSGAAAQSVTAPSAPSDTGQSAVATADQPSSGQPSTDRSGVDGRDVGLDNAPPAAASPSVSPDNPGSQPAHVGVGGNSPPFKAPTFHTPYPANAMGYGSRLGAYYVSRWAEDWSFLADRPKDAPKDLFDALKFIPIAGRGADGVYLTLSNEERFRVDYTTSPGLKAGRDQDQELLRSVVGADLHFGEHLRVYGELNSSQLWGANKGTVTAIQRNDVVVQQLFAEAKANVAGATIGAMVGRQEFQDGPISLVTLRPDNNVYVAMNGVRLYAAWSKVRVDLFSFRSTDFHVNGFDDGVLKTERFKGVTTSFVVPPIGKAKLFLDPFFYRYRNDDKRWGGIVGPENRNIYGARLWGNIGRLTLDLTAVRQDGHYNDRAISASGAFASMEYAVSDQGMKPRIGFHIDYGSGGGAYTGGKLHDFNFIFGSTPYYSFGHFVVSQNMLDIAPRVRVSPFANVVATAEVEFLHRANQNDAVYSNTAAYAGTQTVAGHAIGALFRGDVRYAVSRHFGVSVLFEHLDAGPVLTRAGYGDSTYMGGSTSFYF